MKTIFLTVREENITLRKEIRDTVDQKLIKWILSLKLLPIIVSNGFNFSHLKNFKSSGLIISGGSNINKKSKRYRIDKSLLKWAKENKKPVLGICYGMQFLSYMDGVKLKKIKGHVNKLNKIKSIHSFKFPQKVKCYHNYSFSVAPKNYFITAVDRNGLVEGIKHKKLNWHGWMWHPERNKNFNQGLQRIAKKIFNK